MGALSLLLICTGLSRAALAGGSPMLELVPADAGTGIEAVYGDTYGFRVTARVRALRGGLETRHVAITSDGLFKMSESRSLQLARVMTSKMTVGAVEALWKAGHVGLGFDGVTFGNDIDRGRSDILEMGAYLLVSLLRSESAELDLHSGIELETARIALGDPVDRKLLEQEAAFRWQLGRWTGDARVSMGMDATRPLETQAYRYGGSLDTGFRLFTVGGVSPSVGLRVSGDLDPFREAYGMPAYDYRAGAFLDLSWAPKFLRSGGR